MNILVFDLHVQLQHCTYQTKTLLFALIKVSTFICKREILDLSSPLRIKRRICLILINSRTDKSSCGKKQKLSQGIVCISTMGEYD